MTEKHKKRSRLSFEILGLFAVCLAVAIVLYFFLAYCGVALVEDYCWSNDITLGEEELYRIDTFVFSVSLLFSVGFFVVLFLLLFGDKLSYIRAITKGVDALQRGEHGYKLPIEGNNELTLLAEEINYLSESERKMKEKEKALNDEREELIRTLSHDIRTPLTSMMSYTELLSAKESLTSEEQREYLALVRKKSAQIKELTDILLDGGNRTIECFENAKILFEQLAGELAEVLESDFKIEVDLSGCPAFSGSFDVQDMRRIFDNLISNIQKYADHEAVVELVIEKKQQGLVIRQKNAVREAEEPAESFRMGISSIRRIANRYGGSVSVHDGDGIFEITVTLSNF